MPFCSVSDCKYRTTRSSSVRVFHLPQGIKPVVVNQRRLWQHAIREANGGTVQQNPRVCAEHFISGEASSDFESPDFVPTVFPRPQGRKTRRRELKPRSQEIKKSKTCSPEPTTHTPEHKTRSHESRTHTPEPTTHTPKRMTRSQESRIRTSESENCTPESETDTPERKTRSKESQTHTPKRMTRSQESRTRSPEPTTHTPKRTTRSQESRTRTPESENCTPESENCTPESETHTPERKTRSKESQTHTPKRMTRSQEIKTHPQGSKTHIPERKTRSQEGEIHSQRIETRSQEGKIHIQQRQNRKRIKNWIFGSRKRRYFRARSKTDASTPDLQPSALREPRNELSEEEEEEQTPLSPSALKEGETLTDAEKVSLDSQTESRLSGIPPSLPAHVTAQLRRRPVVRLKRVVVPTAEFRCELCGQTFAGSPPLAKHRELHNENSRFICEICGMSFTVKEEFTAHQSDHPKLEPYFPCNICDRSFSTAQHLKRHKLLHVRDGRKCLKCGTLFCQRHNHVLYLPQPKVKSESEEESEEEEEESEEEEEESEEEEEEEEEASEESQEVECDLMKKKESPVKTEPSQVAETPAGAEKARLIIPATNNPVVTVSMIPVLGVFGENHVDSTSPPRIEILPQVSPKTAEPSPLPRSPVLLLTLPPSPAPPPLLPPPLPPLLPPPLPPLLPPPPLLLPPPPPPLLPPTLKYPGDDVPPPIQPKTEEPDPPAAEGPSVPKCSDFPPSLKMFSPHYLTSALLEVKRNYESIFNKPKRFKGVAKKEEEPLPVSSRDRLVKPGTRRRVAYDLEIVL